MSDLANSVIIPRDDFAELQAAAYDPTTLSQKDRTLGMLRGTFILAACAGAVTAGSWGWAKAVDWREERKFQRDMKLRAADRFTNKK